MSKPKHEDVATLLQAIAVQINKSDNVSALEAAEILARNELERAERLRDTPRLYLLPPARSDGEHGAMAVWPIEGLLKNEKK